MDMLQQLYCGRCIPASELGNNTSPEYDVALRHLGDIVDKLRQYGVPDDLLEDLDRAENALMALEEERMFRFAIIYGAKLQRAMIGEEKEQAGHLDMLPL